MSIFNSMEIVMRTVRGSQRPILSLMKRGLYHDLDRYKKKDKCSSSPFTRIDPGVIKSSKTLQFSQSIFDKNGSLPYGEIPEPLKFERPCQISVLNNGIRVCTEYWPNKVASIGVVIGAGSRHETLETSGTAHFMEHLHFKVF